MAPLWQALKKMQSMTGKTGHGGLATSWPEEVAQFLMFWWGGGGEGCCNLVIWPWRKIWYILRLFPNTTGKVLANEFCLASHLDHPALAPIKSRISTTFFAPSHLPYTRKNSIIFKYLFFYCPLINIGTNEENIIKNFFCFISGGAGPSEPSPAPTKMSLLQQAPALQHWLV